jgi:MFS family permease
MALLFPLFFQMTGEIFLAQDMVFDSGGKLWQLPLPISVIACVIGLILLLRSERSVFAVNYIFFSFALMVFSTLVLGAQDGGSISLGKMILLVQFVLPMFALVLGVSWMDDQLAGRSGFSIERIFLYVVLVIVLAQLIATFAQGRSPLTPYLYLFSIYQHLQYVSLIMVGVYWWTSIACFESRNERRVVMVLAPLIGLYSAESISFQVVGIAVVGALALPILRGFKWRPVLVSMLVIGGLVVGFVSDHELSGMEASAQSDYPKPMRWNHKFNNEKEPLPQAEVVDGAPIAIESRVYVWRYYWEGITESFSFFLFGHADRPERSLMSSAYNYLFDLVYNYGFLSAIPFIYLITVTMRRMGAVWKKGHIQPDLLALAGLVLLLVLGGNTLTVGLRQPYAGIFTFFIWGLLLGRLGLPGMDRGGAKAGQAVRA